MKNKVDSELLREIARVHQALMIGYSREVGVAASKFAVMRQMALGYGNPGVMELARRLGVNPAAVTRQVKELERDGLVLRQDDPTDRRRNFVELSPKGMRLFKEHHDRLQELEHSLAELIGPEDAKVTLKVLSSLRKYLEQPRPND